MGKLRKGSSTPLYKQLVQVIEEQISSGALKEGDQIMTEVELSAEYDVSRITVRKAIELLVEDGILMKRQGVGTFVAEKKIHRKFEGVMGFTQNCLMEGKVAGSKLLAAELVEPAVMDVETLKLSPNEKVIRIVRLRLCDGTPVILEENRFSQKFAFLLSQNLEGSIYQLLGEAGYSMERGAMEIEICQANELESKYLEVEQGKPLLLTKAVVTDEQGEPIHYCKNIINLSHYKMTVVS